MTNCIVELKNLPDKMFFVYLLRQKFVVKLQLVYFCAHEAILALEFEQVLL